MQILASIRLEVKVGLKILLTSVPIYLLIFASGQKAYKILVKATVLITLSLASTRAK